MGISVIQLKNIRKDKRFCCKCTGEIAGRGSDYIYKVSDGKYLCRKCQEGGIIMKDKIAEIDKLLPCPFCGGEAEIVGGPEDWSPTFNDPDSGGDPVSVVCKNCECGLHFFEDYEKAIAAWNQRAYLEQGRELAQYKSSDADKERYTIELYNRARVAEQECDKRKQELENAQADNAALIEALDVMYKSILDADQDWSGESNYINFSKQSFAMEVAEIALNSPHPGAALLEELAQLRTIRDAVEEIVELDWGSRNEHSSTIWKLINALAQTKAGDRP